MLYTRAAAGLGRAPSTRSGVSPSALSSRLFVARLRLADIEPYVELAPEAASGRRWHDPPMSERHRWVVDGANVIGARPDGWWRDRIGALERLLDELIRWREETGEPVLVMLDGHASRRVGDETRYGVTVRHAGATARDAADDAIVEHLERSEDARAVTVVTSDRRLRERATARGAKVEGARRFLERLADIEARRADRRVLARFGLDERALLGRGGEARVFQVDDHLVVRLPHPGTPDAALDVRRALLEALATVDIGVALPEVLEHRVIDDRTVVIERRLPGRDAMAVLGERGTDRAALVRDHLDVAARIARLPCPVADFGAVLGGANERAPSFEAWSVSHLGRTLASGGESFAHVDAERITAELLAVLPAARRAVLAHLDAFLGNMLAEGDRITAVLDFGGVSAAALPSLDPLAAVAYLAPEITVTATPSDRAAGEAWACEAGLAAALGPVERWVAAMWAGVPDDGRLRRWCRRVLR